MLYYYEVFMVLLFDVYLTLGGQQKVSLYLIFFGVDFNLDGSLYWTMNGADSECAKFCELLIDVKYMTVT